MRLTLLILFLAGVSRGKFPAVKHPGPTLARRDGGYHPELAVCKTGATCEEACGKEYRQCTSKDSLLHCFKPSFGETCCPGDIGSKWFRTCLDALRLELKNVQSLVKQDITAPPTPHRGLYAVRR